MLFIAFGIIAIMIATTGVYASTTYGVSRRRREMNIGVALGASLPDVFALVLPQTAVPLAAGVVAGVAGALAARAASSPDYSSRCGRAIRSSSRSRCCSLPAPACARGVGRDASESPHHPVEARAKIAAPQRLMCMITR